MCFSRPLSSRIFLYLLFLQHLFNLDHMSKIIRERLIVLKRHTEQLFSADMETLHARAMKFPVIVFNVIY